jgi:hypothetical protein
MREALAYLRKAFLFALVGLSVLHGHVPSPEGEVLATQNVPYTVGGIGANALALNRNALGYVLHKVGHGGIGLVQGLILKGKKGLRPGALGASPSSQAAFY